MVRVILLTGPSGAGKSTTAKRFMERAEREWAYIPQDEIRELIKAGYESAGDYYENWNDGTKRQYAVSIPICTDMTRRYVEYGINVFVDFFAFPDQLDKWKSGLEGVEYELFILRPDLETTIEQNRQRSGGARLKDNKIKINHDGFGGTHKEARLIDSTDMSVDEVVDVLIGERSQK